MLRRKLTRNLGQARVASERIGVLERLFDDPESLDDLSVPELLDQLSA